MMMGRIDAAELRNSVLLSSIVSQSVKLRRAGREWIGCCPFHADRTPSFSVSDEKGLFHCFGCGAGGDVFDFVMRRDQLSFSEAVRWIDGGSSAPRVPPVSFHPVKQNQTEETALRIWNQAVPIRNTVAEKYLASRCLPVVNLSGLSALRFARLPYRGSRERHPVLVAAVTDLEGRVCGIQRTYLSDDGSKLDVPAPKLSLGRLRGGAIRIGEGSDVIAVCEGLEDGLSIWLTNPELSVWIAAGAGMMASMRLPEGCRQIIVAADRDEAGMRAAAAAKHAYSRCVSRVKVIHPLPGFKDFNAQLQAEVSR